MPKRAYAEERLLRRFVACLISASGFPAAKALWNDLPQRLNITIRRPGTLVSVVGPASRCHVESPEVVLLLCQARLKMLRALVGFPGVQGRPTFFACAGAKVHRTSQGWVGAYLKSWPHQERTLLGAGSTEQRALCDAIDHMVAQGSGSAQDVIHAQGRLAICMEHLNCIDDKPAGVVVCDEDASSMHSAHIDVRRDASSPLSPAWLV